MITLKLNRTTYGEAFTLGTLETPTQTFHTLEDKVRERKGVPVCDWKEPGCTAIPCGVYPLVIDMSARFKRLMPHILKVDGFEGVRIHAGNSQDDTEGCILIGRSVSSMGDMVLQSRMAVSDFMVELHALIDSGEQIQIEIA